MSVKKRDEMSAWKELQGLAGACSLSEERKSLMADNMRNDALIITHDGFMADFRSSPISQQARAKLVALANQCDLTQWREDLFAGERINNTEQRAVLHMALRAQQGDDFHVDGRDVVADVIEVRNRFLSFAEDVRSGMWCGAQGDKITDVINIGIGGSDLGPFMVCDALKGYENGPKVHFVSNVDAAHLMDVLKTCNAKTTLFIITSKTFTTQETLLNAQSAKRWVLEHLGQAHQDEEEVVSKHFVAVSTNIDKAVKFGIDQANIFPFWDWVGGRFSLWSSVGLSIALSVGKECFLEFLDGARSMDQHFRTAPFERNIPVMAALMGVYYRNFMGCSSLAILPYAQRLNLLPAFLQQLEMESNGKSVDREGDGIAYDTAPVIFGQAGTNGQHAFYQMLHQGREVIPCDFIGVEQVETDQTHHRILTAHMAAQMEALREGQLFDEALTRHQDDLKARHSIFEGGRPAHSYILPKLSPYYLGMLIALYEHKVFVQGVIWGVNSFDQWGVQLGKDLAQKYI